MRKMIFISTAPGREHWVKDCSASITLPHTIVSMPGNYELGKIRWILENTIIDRFIFLQDSVVIRNEALLVQAFECSGSVCLYCSPNCFGCYLGLYERESLLKVPIPDISHKDDSIECESQWTKRYIDTCGGIAHHTDRVSRDVFTVARHGRENALTLTSMFDKYRGDYGQNPHNPTRDWNHYLDVLATESKKEIQI
jgi:hypothetical protein